jgi:hypothetical protein
LKWVQSFKFAAPACQKGLLLTLQATIGIWEKLKKDISYLMTNRLNQDCIENAFSSIRRRGGFRDNPSTFEFRSAVKGVIVYSFLKRYNSNCKEDSDVHLLDISRVNTNVVLALCDHNDENDFPVLGLLQIDESVVLHAPVIIESNVGNVIEENALAYIAGFLANKYLKKVSCPVCKDLLVGPKILSKHTLLLYFKEYDSDSTYGLQWPTDEFFDRMKRMGVMFYKNINSHIKKPNIRKNIIATMCNIDFNFFNDHSHQDIARHFFFYTFVTMMIRYKIRMANGDVYLQQTNKQKNKKLKIVKNM